MRNVARNFLRNRYFANRVGIVGGLSIQFRLINDVLQHVLRDVRTELAKAINHDKKADLDGTQLGDALAECPVLYLLVI